MSTTLYEISAELSAFEQMLCDAEGEIPEEFEQQLDAWLADMTEKRDEKFNGYASLIVSIEHRAWARESEIRRMTKLKQVDTNAAERLRNRLKAFFEVHGITKVETDRFTLALQNIGGVLPIVLDIDLDVEDLPEKFQKKKIEINNGAIREALNGGEELTFARFGKRGQSLRIR